MSPTAESLPASNHPRLSNGSEKGTGDTSDLITTTTDQVDAVCDSSPDVTDDDNLLGAGLEIPSYVSEGAKRYVMLPCWYIS